MLRCISTAYGPPWEGIQGTGVTATGIDLRLGQHYYIIAVDPRVIPLHSHCAVDPNPFGLVVVFRAEDTGGAILGNHIDFYDWRGRAKQLAWGKRYVDVTILGQGAIPVQPNAPSSGGSGYPSLPTPETAHALDGDSRYDYSQYITVAGHNITRGSTYVRKAADVMRNLRK